jgi:hypothetical protein
MMASSIAPLFNCSSSSSVRGLPDGGQHDVAEEYLRSFTTSWDAPTDWFVQRATTLLREYIWKMAEGRFGHFSQGGLLAHVWCVRVSFLTSPDVIALTSFFFQSEAMEAHLQDCVTKTQGATTLLLNLERSPHTRNDRYYRECKDKFLSHLKMQRELATGSTVLRDLKRMATPGEVPAQASFAAQVNSAKTAVNKIGIPLTDDMAFAKLLPPHFTDPALEDMAKICAGFEGTPLSYRLSCVMEKPSHCTLV